MSILAYFEPKQPFHTAKRNKLLKNDFKQCHWLYHVCKFHLAVNLVYDKTPCQTYKVRYMELGLCRYVYCVEAQTFRGNLVNTKTVDAQATEQPPGMLLM